MDLPSRIPERIHIKSSGKFPGTAPGKNPERSTQGILREIPGKIRCETSREMSERTRGISKILSR